MAIRPWQIGQSIISLSLEGEDRLAYSVDGRKSTFSTPHYSAEQALEYAGLFHRAIEQNLSQGPLQSSFFFTLVSCQSQK